jgi:hypothetical protein
VARDTSAHVIRGNRGPRQRSAARISAPDVSLRTGFSPKPLGFGRRHSSTNKRSSKLVVRVVRNAGLEASSKPCVLDFVQIGGGEDRPDGDRKSNTDVLQQT